MRRIAHISDLHFGAEEPPIVAGLLADLERQSPDIVVVSGDLTQRAKVHQFEAARAFLDRIASPKIIVPGNHDVPLYDMLRRFFSPLGRYRRIITDNLYPSFYDQELAVVGVNTARSATFKNGRISLEQIARMQIQFDSAPVGAFKVLVAHHPFIPPEGDIEAVVVGRVKLALRMLETSGCALILSGHLHRAYSGDVRPFHLEMKRAILVAQAGTATSYRRRDGEANTYNQVTIDGDRLEIEVRAWDGQQFITGGERDFERTENGWIAMKPTKKPDVLVKIPPPVVDPTPL